MQQKRRDGQKGHIGNKQQHASQKAHDLSAQDRPAGCSNCHRSAKQSKDTAASLRGHAQSQQGEGCRNHQRTGYGHQAARQKQEADTLRHNPESRADQIKANTCPQDARMPDDIADLSRRPQANHVNDQITGDQQARDQNEIRTDCEG